MKVVQIIGLLILFSGVTYFHIRQLKKEKLKRELIIFIALMFLVTGLEFIKIYGVALPNPLELISFTMKPFSRLMTSLTK